MSSSAVLIASLMGDEAGRIKRQGWDPGSHGAAFAFPV